MTLMYINPEEPEDIFPYKQKQLDSPIVDSLKESQFHPDLQSYIVTNCRVREDESYWVELFIQYGTKTPPIEIYLNNWLNNKEILSFLKNLNDATSNLIKFIEKNELQNKTSIN